MACSLVFLFAAGSTFETTQRCAKAIPDIRGCVCDRSVCIMVFVSRAVRSTGVATETRGGVACISRSISPPATVLVVSLNVSCRHAVSCPWCWCLRGPAASSPPRAPACVTCRPAGKVPHAPPPRAPACVTWSRVPSSLLASLVYPDHWIIAPAEG